MLGIGGISSITYRTTLRMGAINRNAVEDDQDPVTGKTPSGELPSGPAIARQRGVRIQDAFRTPDLPPATEANEAAMLATVKTLFATEVADPSRIDISTETRSAYGQRQLGVNIEYYYNHPTFVNQKSPTDTDHTLRHAYNRLLTLKDQGVSIDKEVPPTGIVANGIPVRLIMGHYLAPNQFVLGGGQVATLTDGTVMAPSRINRQAAEETP